MFFFFQAEDGIRDVAVTGVQTCALPISRRPAARLEGRARAARRRPRRQGGRPTPRDAPRRRERTPRLPPRARGAAPRCPPPRPHAILHSPPPTPTSSRPPPRAGGPVGPPASART